MPFGLANLSFDPRRSNHHADRASLGTAGTSSRESKTIATLDGQPILEDQIPSSVRAQLQKMKQDENALEQRGLNAVLEQKLLESEAKRKGVSIADFLASEVDGKVPDPTPSEVEAYSLGRQTQNAPSVEEMTQLRQALKSLKIQQARQNYFRKLLQDATSSGEVVVLLQSQRVAMGFDSARLKGSPQAPVIIVEFADFSCPYCREAEGTMKSLLAEYQGKVSLAYRDYPLREAHPHAQLAAEASRCAADQGRFWEYHDLLFATPGETRTE